jgi:hypothetical protein
MARKKLPEEYQAPIDLAGIGDEVRAQERPLASALGMLYRSTKLPQEIIDAIAADARKGYDIEYIAPRIGMAASVLRTYVARGQTRREQIDEWMLKRRTLDDDACEEDILAEIGPPPEEDDLLMLFDAFARSEANHACGNIDVLNDEAVVKGNWKAAAYLLEVRHGFGSKRSLRGKTNDERDDGPANAIDLLGAKVAAFEKRAGERAALPATG